MSVESKIYSTRFGEEEMGGRIELWRTLCRYWLPKYIPEDARVLDLGAGYCEFINNIACATRTAIDRNPDFVNHASDEVACITAGLDDGLRQLDAASIDRIMASNVFEHLPDRAALFACIEEAHRVLVPGGKILVMQPNISAVKERFYDFADHSLPLTEKGMAESLEACGFVIERQVARFLPYTTKGRYPPWPVLVRLYLLFPPAHRLLGGQMFIVGRKPAAKDEG